MSAGAGAGARVEPDLEFLLEPEWSRVKNLTGSATLIENYFSGGIKGKIFVVKITIFWKISFPVSNLICDITISPQNLQPYNIYPQIHYIFWYKYIQKR